jgi:gluconate 2-dehydrogenase gamma chain
VLAAQMPAFLATMDLACTAASEEAPLRVLGADLAGFVEAFTSRILPTDHRPGAAEADVVRFIDMVFDTMPPFQGAEEIVSTTKAGFEAEAGQSFVSLSPEEQDRHIAGVESEVTFGVLQFLTLAGFLTHPSRGGNQGKVGWDLIGFDDRHAWQPPFGYYDAQLINEAGTGA